MKKIVGILNVTPDSFYDGGKYAHFDQAIKRGLEIEKEGADIIDIGGESTRPFSLPLPEEEERARLIPVVKELKKHLTIPISIDSMKPYIVKLALDAGADIINDVGGFRDDEMIKVAKDFNCPLICMHMRGSPKTMQINPFYKEGIVTEIMNWAKQKVQQLLDAGISKDKIILDPGIGFGKTVADNLEIIHNLPRLKGVGFPVLIGASYKSFLSKILEKPSEELAEANIAVHTAALLLGADYVRVHDVSAMKDARDFLEKMKLAGRDASENRQEKLDSLSVL